MCPTDTTPDPRDMLRAPETPEFLEPDPSQSPKKSTEASPASVTAEQRPALPTQPRIMAADVEDEDADPVVETGPGVGDGELNRG